MNSTDIVLAEQYQPVMSLDGYRQRYALLKQFAETILQNGKDYGTVEGIEKPTLFKPGAEKACTFFGLYADPEPVEVVQDWTGKDHGGEPFFFYRYRVTLYKGDVKIASAYGSSNSWEKKHRWRWVTERDALLLGYELDTLMSRVGSESEFAFAIEKAETTGKYGKPASYWAGWRMDIESGRAHEILKPTRKGDTLTAWVRDATVYRVPNPDNPDIANTVDKMALKRGLVGAVLIGLGLSEFFTQDVEDIVEGSIMISPDEDQINKPSGADDTPAVHYRCRAEGCENDVPQTEAEETFDLCGIVLCEDHLNADPSQEAWQSLYAIYQQSGVKYELDTFINSNEQKLGRKFNHGDVLQAIQFFKGEAAIKIAAKVLVNRV